MKFNNYIVIIVMVICAIGVADASDAVRYEAVFCYATIDSSEGLINGKYVNTVKADIEVVNSDKVNVCVKLSGSQHKLEGEAGSSEMKVMCLSLALGGRGFLLVEKNEREHSEQEKALYDSIKELLYAAMSLRDGASMDGFHQSDWLLSKYPEGSESGIFIVNPSPVNYSVLYKDYDEVGCYYVHGPDARKIVTSLVWERNDFNTVINDYVGRSGGVRGVVLKKRDK